MSTPLTDERLAEMRAELDYAGKELGEICKEGPSRRWRMRIPANADDSDLVLSAAIVAGEELLAEVERLRAQMAAVEKFCAARAEYITAINNCPPENSHDYWRWQGHAEGRRQLSQELDLPVAWPTEYKRTEQVTP